MPFKSSPVFRIVGFCCVSIVMLACDATPKSTAMAAQPRIEQYTHAKQLEGLVTNDSGPVKTGIIQAITEQGKILATAYLQGQPRYSLDLPAGTTLPLILSYAPDTNASEDQRMMTVAIHSNTSKYDINPASTRISKLAKAMGGYTHNHWISAAESSGIVPADNKTTAGFRGDPTKQYGGWH